MKHRNTNRFLLVLLTSIMLGLFVPLSSGATYTYYRENFETEATNTNPVSNAGEIPYAYVEFGYTATDVGVNTTFDGSNRFAINESTTGPTDGWANFTFNTSYAYDYFECYFEYLNDYTIWQNHSGISIILAGNVGTILTLNIFGANHTVVPQQNRAILYDYNSVIQANVSIAKDTWYKVRFDPDYDSWDDNIQVTVTAVGGSDVIDHTLDLNGNINLVSIKMRNTPASAKVCFLMDSFTLLKTDYTQGEQTTNYIAEYVIPIVFATAMLAAIAMYAMTGGLDPKTLITLLIALIIGFITLMIVTTI